MYECIIKTARYEDNTVLWQGLYLEGKKVLENFEIDLNVALPIFAPNVSSVYEVNVLEFDFSDIIKSFPDEEDFSYLLDYKDLSIGDKVWLEDGEYVVTTVKTDYRAAGKYTVTEWYSNIPIPVEVIYCGHNVTIFTVEGNTKEYVWEDYNYQQSNLYELNKKLRKSLGKLR
jgi:hypothetical protein